MVTIVNDAAGPSRIRPGSARGGLPALRLVPGEGPAVARRAALVLLLAVSVLWPAFLNRSPIIHPDTLGYLRAGEHVLQALGSLVGRLTHGGAASAGPAIRIEARLDHFSPERSVYYGAFLATLVSLGGVWLAALTQGVLAVVTVMIARSRFSAKGDPHGPLVWTALVLVSGLPFFASTLMPDIFTGVLILAIATLLAPGRPLAAAGALYLYAMIWLAVVFHASHLALASALVVIVALVQLLLGALARATLARIAGVILAGALASAAATIAIGTLLHTTVVLKPFVLARLQSDGPAADYLKQHCAAGAYDLCRFRDRLPEPVNDFLWSTDPRRGVLAIVGVPEQQRIASEAPAIILGTIIDHPFRQALASTADAAEQVFSVGVTEYGRPARLDGISTTSGFYATAKRYLDQGGASRAPLGVASALMLAAYLASLLGLAALAADRVRRAPPPKWTALRGLAGDGVAGATLIGVAGVVANAAICGGLSGVFDRYQGRVAWIVVLAAAVAVSRARAPRGVTPATAD